MSSHIDDDYVRRLKNLVTSVVTGAPKHRPSSVKPVQMLTHQHLRRLSFWHKPETRVVEAVELPSYTRPENPTPEGNNGTFPEVVVDTVYLRLKEPSDKPTVLIPADYMGKQMEGVYKDVSIETYLDMTINAKARYRNEVLANEEALWGALSVLLPRGDSFFETSYSDVLAIFEARRRKDLRGMATRKSSRSRR